MMIVMKFQLQIIIKDPEQIIVEKFSIRGEQELRALAFYLKQLKV
jgi:hypothetical protein